MSTKALPFYVPATLVDIGAPLGKPILVKPQSRVALAAAVHKCVNRLDRLRSIADSQALAPHQAPPIPMHLVQGDPLGKQRRIFFPSARRRDRPSVPPPPATSAPPTATELATARRQAQSDLALLASEKRVQKLVRFECAMRHPVLRQVIMDRTSSRSHVDARNRMRLGGVLWDLEPKLPDIDTPVTIEQACEALVVALSPTRDRGTTDGQGWQLPTPFPAPR